MDDFYSELRKSIRDNRLEEVMKLMLDWLLILQSLSDHPYEGRFKKHYDEVIATSAKYKELENKIRQGKISEGKALKYKTRITYSVLELLRIIEKEDEEAQEQASREHVRKQKMHERFIYGVNFLKAVLAKIRLTFTRSISFFKAVLSEFLKIWDKHGDAISWVLLILLILIILIFGE